MNIPIVALLFALFSMLTLRHAQWLFVAISLVGVVVTVLLLWSLTDREPVATMGDPDAVCDERAAGVQLEGGI